MGVATWTQEQDDMLRQLWRKDADLRAIAEELSPKLGRSAAAILTRFYALGFRKWTSTEKAEHHKRAQSRRDRIEAALLNGERRKPLCAELGVSETLIHIYRSGLRWAGKSLPPAPSWGQVGNTSLRPPELWRIINGTAFSQYHDAISPTGKNCKCKHKESLHIGGICTAVYARGGGCECGEFFPASERRARGFGNQDAMRYAVSLETPLTFARETKTIGDTLGYQDTGFEDVIAAA